MANIPYFFAAYMTSGDKPLKPDASAPYIQVLQMLLDRKAEVCPEHASSTALHAAMPSRPYGCRTAVHALMEITQRRCMRLMSETGTWRCTTRRTMVGPRAH